MTKSRLKMDERIVGYLFGETIERLGASEDL